MQNDISGTVSNGPTAVVRWVREYGHFAPAWSQTKGTDASREVLLNDRALQVLEKARPTTAARSDDVFAPKGSGDRSELHIRSETGAKRHG